jgi:hypothetical protein
LFNVQQIKNPDIKILAGIRSLDICALRGSSDVKREALSEDIREDLSGET